MKHRKSDGLWKMITDELFTDFLKFIFPDADHVYDLTRGFDFLDKELLELDPQPEEAKDSRFADKLVKLYHSDGSEEWILLHIEIQGQTPNPLAFADRMLTYFYRIRDKHKGKLISAFVLYTGDDGRYLPGEFKYEYRGTQLYYKFPKLSILDFTDEELDKNPNPFAQVIVAARLHLKEGKIAEDDLLKAKILITRKLHEKGFNEVTR